VVGLPASQPAHIRDDGAPVPAVERVRLHDLRHTFATLQLSSGVHFMQVSKWLGHSTFTLTLDTYGDSIPGAEGEWRIRCPSHPPRRSQPTYRATFCSCLVGRRIRVCRRVGLIHFERAAFYAFATLDIMRQAINAATPAITGLATDELTEDRLQALYSLR
jgi:hypothetical protein